MYLDALLVKGFKMNKYNPAKYTNLFRAIRLTYPKREDYLFLICMFDKNTIILF